jgi:DNA polymerase-4
MIAYVRLPFFAVSLAYRDDPSLTGPLVLGGYAWQAGQVVAMSHKPEQVQVRVGMSLRQAQALCPSARFLPADEARYRQLFEQITDALAAYTPHTEPESALQHAGCYLDLRVADALDQARRLYRQIEVQFGLHLRIGLATTRHAARAASTFASHDPIHIIPAGQEAAALAPLPLSTLPLDAETIRQLHLLGIFTVGQFAALKGGAVLSRFGKVVYAAHRLARGQDDWPVATYRYKQSEQMTRVFDDPLSNRQVVDAVLRQLGEILAQRLGHQYLAARTLSVDVVLEDRTQGHSAIMLREPCADPSRLGSTLVALLDQITVESRIGELRVTATNLVQPVARQLTLFDSLDTQRTRLQNVLDNLIARHGSSFYRPTVVQAFPYLPERRIRWSALESV